MTRAQARDVVDSGVRLELESDGRLRVVRRQVVFRFMFDDGQTVDVIADRDDSTMRGALVEWSGGHAIVGSANVTGQQTRLL